MNTVLPERDRPVTPSRSRPPAMKSLRLSAAIRVSNRKSENCDTGVLVQFWASPHVTPGRSFG